MKTKSKLDVTFLKKFPNLKSIRLDNACIDDDIVSMLSSKLSLGSIFLNHCTIEERHLSNIFKNCTALEDIQIVDSECHYNISNIVLPPQLKIFKIGCLSGRVKINLSLCTQLKDLSIHSILDAYVEIISSKVRSLRKLDLKCNFTYCDCFEDSLANLEILTICWPYMSRCQIFGSDKICDIKDCYLDLSSFKFIEELYIMKSTPGDTLRLKLPLGFGRFTIKAIFEEIGRYPQEKVFNRNYKTPTDESITFTERKLYQQSINHYN